ncbi:hypothetical protein [Mesorhizobium sp. M0118]|uniref:hypothetical protein n=1 Tax=Mesorhizobium sp. M0118 TaxID=2956884 RepID=UPI003337F67C
MKYFAEQNGLTPDQVRQLIRTHGNDPSPLREAAKAQMARGLRRASLRAASSFSTANFASSQNFSSILRDSISIY